MLSNPLTRLAGDLDSPVRSPKIPLIGSPCSRPICSSSPTAHHADRLAVLQTRGKEGGIKGCRVGGWLAEGGGKILGDAGGKAVGRRGRQIKPMQTVGGGRRKIWRPSDEDINTIVTPTTPAAIHTRPITRARARQFNYQVLSFLGNDYNVHENMMLPKLDTFVLLTNEGPSLDKKDEPWSKFKHGDDGMRKGIKNRVTSDEFRTLKPP
ncbi:hypothetical protein TRIUR3_33651 [Triticum urartu]|uniref:Uncharacterized protein n=1 Tax=Triticum urartu TaxID=4572 RepID=M7ZK65_TRIUA|nr:hypothetical protein TRIUR3_33651 [Triticum urartu]